MNAFTFLNVALHSLLLSAVGWLAVRWVLRDARHRAWAALLTLIVATFAPLGMNWPHEADPRMEKNKTSTATTWTPDWKVNVTTPQTSSTAESKRPADVLSTANQTWQLEDLGNALSVLALIGSVIALLWHGRQTFRGIVLLRALKRLSPEQEAQIPWREKSYQLRLLPTKSSPCVIGFLKPVIAIPSEAFREFNQRQWEWMLRHEGEHLRAKDPLIAWLLDTVRALFWWNPFVHLLINHWAQAREEICDAAAIQAEKDAPAYAAFLVEIASTSTAQFSMAASTPAKRLKARIQAMLSVKRVQRRVSLTFAAVSLLGTILSVFLISGTGFTNAQETSPNVVVAEPTKEANVPETSAKTPLKPTQIHLTSRWVEVDETLANDEVLTLMKSLSTGAIFTESEYERIQRKLAQRKGVALMSGPSVTTRSGQKATVEVVQEFQVEQTSTKDFIGVQNGYVPS